MQFIKAIPLRACCLLLLMGISVSSVQAQQENKEYDLKAGFLYNFTKYIEWYIPESEKEFIIGVVGDSPITGSLKLIARTKMVEDRKMIIHKFDSLEEIRYCHIIFISRSNNFPISEIADRSSRNTLIVAEREGLASKGAAINFIMVNNNLKFEVNPHTINSAGLKASSQLLKLAILVD